MNLDPQQQVAEILRRLECGRARCQCHAAVRRGSGVTHAIWRGDDKPSLSVGLSEDGDRVLVCDFGRLDQEDTIAELTALGLWHGPSGHPVIRIARMPKGAKDVADLLAQGRDAEFEQMIAEAQPSVAWAISQKPEHGSREADWLGRVLDGLGEVEVETYVRLLAEQQEQPIAQIRLEVHTYLKGRRAVRATEEAPPVWERNAS